MDERDERARARFEEEREEREILKEERAMAAEERKLEREMEEFEKAEKRVEGEVEAEWRREHYGRDPERPPAWRNKPASES